MAHKKTITIIVALLVLGTVSGCLDSNRKVAAQHRWQERLDQAKLESAQQSIENGQWAYAERVLKDCSACTNPESPLSGQAQQILAKIQTVNALYAKTENNPASDEEMVY